MAANPAVIDATGFPTLAPSTSKPRLLLCHNYYQQRGGEDLAFEDEVALLRARGHEVSTYTVHNDEINASSRLSTAGKSIWNGRGYRAIRDLIRRERPDIMHCTNSFPLLSPSAHYAAKAEGVAVVQSLHNYRLLCPGACFLRDGKICEKCFGRSVPLPAIRHACYRNSRAASAAATVTLGIHNLLGTWRRAVDTFLCPSRYTREKFIAAGYPADRMFVVSNCVDPAPAMGQHEGNFAIFVGRLSPEKGITTLLTAWRELGEELPLKIVGQGPESGRVQHAETSMNIEWLGQLSPAQVLDAIGAATCLVMPTDCFETFGRVVVEAYAKGTPVVASDIGAVAELIDEGRTGFRFPAGDANALVECIRKLLADPSRLAAMRRQARQRFEQAFTADSKYAQLSELYRHTLARTRQASAC